MARIWAGLLFGAFFGISTAAFAAEPEERFSAALAQLDRAIEIAKHPLDPTYDPEPMVAFLQSLRGLLQAPQMPEEEVYGPEFNATLQAFVYALLLPSESDRVELLRLILEHERLIRELSVPSKPKQKPEDRLTSILRKIEQLKERQQSAQAPVQAERPQISAVQRQQLENSVQGQIERCWSLDPGARRAENLVVEVTVNLTPDGRVIGQPRVVDAMRMNRDAHFRSAAENAVRAIQKCSPFDLPVAQYTEWKTMTLTLNPREMFGS